MMLVLVQHSSTTYTEPAKQQDVKKRGVHSAHVSKELYSVSFKKFGRVLSCVCVNTVYAAKYAVFRCLFFFLIPVLI
jgi:hypothetical protein